MRLTQLRDYLASKFESIDHYDEFARCYLREMDDPKNVMFMSKFIIKASA
jgi:hypothetical protein